jgi:hypothetical protein
VFNSRLIAGFTALALVFCTLISATSAGNVFAFANSTQADSNPEPSAPASAQPGQEPGANSNNGDNADPSTETSPDTTLSTEPGTEIPDTPVEIAPLSGTGTGISLFASQGTGDVGTPKVISTAFELAEVAYIVNHAGTPDNGDAG